MVYHTGLFVRSQISRSELTMPTHVVEVQCSVSDTPTQRAVKRGPWAN